MLPQGENLCVTGTLFFFGRSSLTVVGIACDTWRTSVCDGARAGNRGGGGGSNLGRRRPRLPLEMAGGKSSQIDVSICINGESEEIRGCNWGRFKEVGGCTDGGSEEVMGCIDGRFEEMGDCTNHGDRKVGGYNDADINEVMDWRPIYY